MIPSTAMTDAQRKLLFSQMEKESIDKVALEDRLGFSIGDLSKQEASVLIDCIMHDGDLDEAIEKILNYRVDNRASVSPSHGSISTEQNSEKSKFTVEPGSELAIAKIAGLPPEMANLFFMKLNGNAYIKVAGLQYMAGKIGYQRIEITDRYDESTKTWVAEAKIYPKISVDKLATISKLSPEVQKMAYEDLSKPTNGVGTANSENVQNRSMHKFLREMAQTRALGRALRSYTGYGGTSYEELPDAEISGDVQ
jgi:hypothetical protein